MKKNILAIALLASVPCVNALQFNPVSYVIDQTPDNGSWTYQDSGGELTDGIFGGFPLNSQAAADSWVAFTDRVVNIDFDLGMVRQFNEVKVDTLQVGVGNIVLPSIFVSSSTDGSTWTLESLIDNSPETGANNGLQFLSLPLAVSSEHLRVSLQFADNGPWTFVSEVQFFGADPQQRVPEGGATVALLGLSMAGLAWIKRKRG